MFYRKSIYILIILLPLYFLHAQRKKTDTVYVYEKVIVYDTIYLEKAVKSKLNDVEISDLNLKAIVITDDRIKNKTAEDKIKPDTRVSIFQYGIEAGIGFKKGSWAKGISDRQQFGQNIGVWASGRLFSNLFLMTSGHYPSKCVS